MNQNMAHVACLVCEASLGREGKSFRIQVEGWIRRNGPEWTCKRLKAIWNVALLLRNGDILDARKVLQDNSIAYHHHDMVPKGPVGVVVRRFLMAQRPIVLKRISAVLRIYTSIRLDNPTRSQVQKAIKNISGPSIGRVKDRDLRTLGGNHIFMSPNFLEAEKFCSTKFSEDEIHCEHLRINSRYYSRYKVPRELRSEPYSSMVMSLLTEPWVPGVLDPRVPCKEMREGMRSQGFEDKQLYYGRISMLQEQGCKARVVCQPTAWLQLAFMPLHNRLAKVCEIMFPRESCVRDQESGVYEALKLMSLGKPVYSTDLSSATDRFPISYSLGVLGALGFNDYADALQEVVQGTFEAKWVPKFKELKYSVGQPMGLYSSFPLFHLSNCCLAYDCARRVKDKTLFPNGSCFMVLGDDIIFSDGSVEALYRKRMEEFGVEISSHKCFRGNVAEFAGFVILRTRQGVTAFRPYKVPEKEWVSNPIQFLDSLGKSVKRLGPIWSKRFETYQKTVSSRSLSLDPLLPSNEGDWNPTIRGDNTTVVRMAHALSLFSEDYGYTLPCPSFERGPPEKGDRTGFRINRSPLFRERGMFDYYRYDRDLLMSPEFREHEKDPHRRKTTTYFCDPLIQEVEANARGEHVPDPRLVHPHKVANPLKGDGPHDAEALTQIGQASSPSRVLTLDERIALAKAKAKQLNRDTEIPRIRKNKVFDDLDLG